MPGVYVFNHDDVDITTTGLVGDLQPVECIFTEEKNGESGLSMTLCYDSLGKWRAVKPGCYIKAKVPVRVPPKIVNTVYSETLTTYKVKSSVTRYATVYTSKGEVTRDVMKPEGFGFRYMLDATSGSGGGKEVKVKKTLKAGAEVQVLEDDGTRCKIYAKSFGTGWTLKSNLEEVKTDVIVDSFSGVENVTDAVRLQYQLFQVTQVEQTLDGVTVTALHVFYELLPNFTTYKTEEAVEVSTAIGGMFGNMLVPDERFTCLTDSRDISGPLDYERINMVQALLDPEDGICARYGLSLIRDNYDLYALKNVGSDRGFVVEYGKNMLSVEYTEDITNVVTRIVPFGLTDKGDVVYMDNMYVDSPHIKDYPFPRVQYLDCTDTAVESKEKGKEKTLAQVKAELKARADAEFAAGCDLPEISMTVSFVSLGDTAEYQQYKDLDKVFLFDKITVRDKVRGYDYSAEVVAITHNVLTGLLESVTLGSIRQGTGIRKIATWQVPTVDGSNIRLKSIKAGVLGDQSVTENALQDGSVTGVKLKEATIDKAHIKDAAIGTAQIEDAAINSAKIALLSVETGHIQDLAVTSAKIAQAAIQNAHIATASIDTAKIALGAITQALIQQGAVGTMQIADGSITDAKIVELTANKINAGTLSVERLVIVGSDKSIVYAINQANGTAQLSQTTIDGGALTQRSITADRIVAESITSRELAAECITAIHILSGSITTEKLQALCITADKIAANTITVDKLASNVGSSLDISSNTAITNLVRDVNALPVTHVQYAAPSGVKKGDVWVNTGASTWADLKNGTWQTAKNNPWGAYFNALPVTRVWDGQKWQTVADQSVIMDQYTRITQTDEKISQLATKEELSGKVSRTEYEQDAEAIALRVQTVEQNSGKAETVTNTAMTLDKTGFHLKTGGTFTVDSGNFDLDENGNVSMKSASVNGNLTNNGIAVLTAKNLVVSSTQPTSPVPGMVWVKPVGSTAATFLYNNASVQSFKNFETAHTLTNAGSAVTASGTYTYNVKIPYKVTGNVSATRYLTMYVNGTAIFTDAALEKTAGSYVLELGGSLSQWLGNASSLSFTLNLHYMQGDDGTLHNVHRVDVGAIDLKLYAKSSAASGWSGTEVQVYNG